MGEISVREQGIFVEVEATPGTPETLVAADAVAVEDVNFNPVEQARFADRNTIRDSLNVAQSLYGGSMLGFQFTCELKGSGAAGTAPAIGDLLRACGMSETIVASTSVTYAPISDLSTIEAATIGYKEGVNYRIATGCRGTFAIQAAAGQVPKIQFNMIGRISSETQTAAPTPTFEATVPPLFLGATVQIGAFSPFIEAMSLDLAATVAAAPNPNQADGFGIPRITARNVAGTINPEKEGISTKDFIDELRNGTTQQIQTGVIGGTAGNRWALTIPLAYFKDASGGDREELMTWELGFGAVDTDGTDDFSLQFT